MFEVAWQQEREMPAEHKDGDDRLPSYELVESASMHFPLPNAMILKYSF